MSLDWLSEMFLLVRQRFSREKEGEENNENCKIQNLFMKIVKHKNWWFVLPNARWQIIIFEEDGMRQTQI